MKINFRIYNRVFWNIAIIFTLFVSCSVKSVGNQGLTSDPFILFSSSDKIRYKKSIEQGYQYLYAQMDLYHHHVVIESESPYQDYYPSGFMGDIEAITVSRESCEKKSCGNVHSGRDSLKIEYSSTGEKGWAGLFYQYPDKNWGEFPCRNLEGAKQITFWAKSDSPIRVEIYSGFGSTEVGKANIKYTDSYEKYGLSAVLDGKWRKFSLDTSNLSTKSVCGPLAIVFTKINGAGAVYIDDAYIELSRYDEPRLLQSYTQNNCLIRLDEDGTPKFGSANNVSHIYDQALVVLALLARGNEEDRRRADLISLALIQAQSYERTFKDGRLRNAYASGKLIDEGCRYARLPGKWDDKRQTNLNAISVKNGSCPASEQYEEDEYSLGSDTGNLSWVAIALIQAHSLLPPKSGDPFLLSVRKIANWIVSNHKMNDDFGGFRGGYEVFNEVVGTPTSGQHANNWRSTEHNIDLAVLFSHLEKVDSGRKEYWLSQKQHAIKFLKKMIFHGNNKIYIRTGTKATNEINEDIKPLDAQTWIVLSDLDVIDTKQKNNVIDWAIKNCRSNDNYGLYDFNCRGDGDGVWWEGTAQMALALQHLNRINESQTILEKLINVQQKEGYAKGSIPAASKCGLTTGIYKHWRSIGSAKPWLYPNAPHIGATSWFLFALQNKNPYFLRNHK